MVTKIAVVIPTIFNRPEYLPIAYESLASQQGDFTLEIIVGCPAALVDRVKQVIPGAKVTAEPSEGGLGQKLGQLLASAAAESDFVAWLGDDDLLTTDSLKHSSNEMLKDKQVVMVYGGCDYIDASGKVLFTNKSGDWARKILRFGPQLIPQPGSLMRSHAFLEAGGVTDEFNLAFDFDLFLRLQQHGEFRFLDKTLSQFRWHPDSLSVRRRRVSVMEASRVRRRHYRGAAKYLWWLWEPFVISATWVAGKLASLRARSLAGPEVGNSQSDSVN